MKIALKKALALVIMGFLTTDSSMWAFDLPVFYRPQLFQPSVTKHIEDWRFAACAEVVYGQTRDSFNEKYHKTALFNAYGNFELARLGVGLDNITSKTTTNSYWGTDGPFASPDDLPAGSGQASCGGRFRALECNVELKQNLFWGFFAHVFVPIKDLRLDKITITNTGAAEVNGVVMSDFIATALPMILQENGIDGNVTAPFKKSGVGDVALSAGWHGYKQGLEGIVTALGGLMQIGVIFPTGAKASPDRVFSLPMDYNRQIGIVARGSGEIAFWGLVNVGLQVGALTTLHDEKNIRMITNKQQNGWIVLEKGHASFEQGTIWDLGAYAKIDDMVKGLEIVFGYSLVRQERTGLHVEDAVFLSTVVQNAFTQDPTPSGRGNRFISKDDIVNADNRLSAWEMHSLHFVISYDAAQGFGTSWGPFVKFEYTQPLVGKIAWPTDVVAGALGVTASWNF